MPKTLRATALVCLATMCAATGPVAARGSQAATPNVGLANAPDAYVSFGGTTLRYREAGRGTPILFVHGYAGQLESWIGVADALVATHRVIAFDLRGFGKSTKSGNADQYGAAMSLDILRLLDHLGVSQVHIVGHSLGALVAASAVARDRTRFMSATLVAGPLYADSAVAERDVRPWLAQLEAGQGLTKFLEWLFPGQPQAAIASMNAGLMNANDPSSLIAVMRSVPQLTTPATALAGIPSLLVVGTADPLEPLSKAFIAAGGSTRLIEVRGADHISVVGSPELLRGLQELLQRAEPLRPAA
ncbi:MAG TPA: alpha/beta fold hydrolase [Vicinamibacterales bacterium]